LNSKGISSRTRIAGALLIAADTRRPQTHRHTRRLRKPGRGNGFNTNQVAVSDATIKRWQGFPRARAQTRHAPASSA